MVIQEIRKYEDDFKAWHGAYVNMSFSAHWHEENELIYVRSGSACIEVGDEMYWAEQGDLLLCGSGCVHRCNAKNIPNTLEFILFNSMLVQNRPATKKELSVHISRAELEAKGLSKEIRELFDIVPQELAQRSPYYQEIVKGMLQLFWYKLQRLLSDKFTKEAKTEDVAPMQQALQYLENNYAGQITLEEVAAHVNMSTCYFSRMFKEYTGLGFVNYRNYLRLEKAAEMLQQTTTRVSTIAFNSGFQDIRTFNRVFQQYTGHPPSAYRNDRRLKFQPIFVPYRYRDTQLEVQGKSAVVTERTGDLTNKSAETQV